MSANAAPKKAQLDDAKRFAAALMASSMPTLILATYLYRPTVRDCSSDDQKWRKGEERERKSKKERGEREKRRKLGETSEKSTKEGKT